MPKFDLIPRSTAELATATGRGKRVEMMKEYLSYIEELKAGQAGRLTPSEGESVASVRRRLGTAARLAGKEHDAPSHADTETNVPELRARIESVLGYLRTFSVEDFAGAAERRITQPRWKGKTLSGEEFLIQHAIPNLYFHVTTAYAICRHNGMGIGKKTYLGTLPYRE